MTAHMVGERAREGGDSRTLKVRDAIIFQANRYLGGFSSSQRIFPPQTIQVLLDMLTASALSRCDGIAETL